MIVKPITKQIDQLMGLAYDYAGLRINWESGNTNQTTPHLVDAAEKKLRAALEAALQECSNDTLWEVNREVSGSPCQLTPTTTV